MTPERWRRIEELFDRTVDLPPPDRAALLDAACAGDDELRTEVEQLVASQPGAVASLHRALAQGTALLEHAVTAGRVGARFGPYRLREILGEGGMGTVYRATRDDAEYQREVAIKILRPIVASPALVARLRDERQLLASLDHPGIVRLLDGGSTDEGLPYLVMEYIAGVPITAYARDRPVRARVELVVAIGAALQYAHQKLIVHRDVKPSNIVVDGGGAPKLLDFGIAKLLDPQAGPREAQTATGMPLFTVEYASPEQARGEPVSVATDVYSLGAVLYELLTGRTPQQRGATLVETLANICDRDPPRPSAVAPAELRRQLAGDLDNIVLRALQKAPARRYPSVALLVDDLERYLDGRPVRAREATLGYRAGKLVARHRGKLALAALVAAALSAATVVSVLQARRADRQTAEAERQKRSLLRQRGLQELASGHASRALPYLAEALREGDDSPAIRLAIADAMRPESRRLAAIPVTTGDPSVAWSPRGDRFAITASAGRAALYDLEGHRLARLHAPTISLERPAFSPEGSQLVATGAGHVLAWDTATGALRFSIDTHHDVIGSTLTSDGTLLVVAMLDGALLAYDAHTGELRREVRVDTLGGAPSSFAATADGRQIAIGTPAGPIYLWDASRGDPPRRLDGTAGPVRALCFSPDSTRLYSGGDDHALRGWDVGRGTAVIVASHDRTIYSIDVDRAGSRIAVASDDHTATLHDAHTGAVIAVMSGLSSGGVGPIQFSPDGAHLVSLAGDGTFRLWDHNGNPETAFDGALGADTMPHVSAAAIRAARFSPDGTRLLTASGSEVDLWRVDRAPLVMDLAFDRGRFAAVWSPDESRIAIIGSTNPGIWDAASQRQVAAFDVGGVVNWDVAWAPGGDRLAIAGDGGLASIRDERGAPLAALVGHRGIVNRIAWSPDGARLVTAGDDHTAQIWNAAGALLRTLPHGDRVMAAAWRSDGAQIVTAGWDHRLRLWDAARGALVSTIDAGGMQLLDASFSPDGRRLAASSHAGEVGIWDATTGARLVSLEGHADAVPMAVWSPDGGLIATAGYDHAVRIWDPDTGELIVTRPASEMMSLAWNRDGSRVIGASEDGHVLAWDVHRAAEPVAAILDHVTRRVPLRLVGAHLERVPPDRHEAPDATSP